MKPASIKKLPNGSILGLLEMNNSTAEMLKSLNWEQSKLNAFHSLRSEKKKKEWLGLRLLLGEIFKKQSFDLKYNDQGKPFLQNPDHNISISHSGKFICVLINESKEIGIDIQVFKPNIDKGIGLFMNEKELKDCAENLNNNALHIYWGAKESIYKLVGLQQTNIKTDIYISPFVVGIHGKLEGRYLTEKIIDLNYKISSEYVLVYTV